MAPKKAKALLWVVATKPLPVRLRSSVGVRRRGGRRASLFFGDALPLRRSRPAAAWAWVKTRLAPFLSCAPRRAL